MKTVRLLSSLPQLSLLARAGLLAGSLTLAFALIAPIAFFAKGPVGLLACAFAAVVCLVSGLLALGLGELFRGPDAALFNLLVGLAVRMGVPLAACVAVYALGGPLVDGGMAFYLLAFYPVLLVVETVLLTAQVEADAHSAASEANHG